MYLDVFYCESSLPEVVLPVTLAARRSAAAAEQTRKHGAQQDAQETLAQRTGVALTDAFVNHFQRQKETLHKPTGAVGVFFKTCGN